MRQRIGGDLRTGPVPLTDAGGESAGLAGHTEGLQDCGELFIVPPCPVREFAAERRGKAEEESKQPVCGREVPVGRSAQLFDLSRFRFKQIRFLLPRREPVQGTRIDAAGIVRAVSRADQAVDDMVRCVQQNEVGNFPEHLHDNRIADPLIEGVLSRKRETYHALAVHSLDLLDDGTRQMFPQKHAEHIGAFGIVELCIRQIQAGASGAYGKQELPVPSALVQLKDDLPLVRHQDLNDLRSCQFLIQFSG